MGCGCGGGRRNTGQRRTTTVSPRSATPQARPVQNVQGLSLPGQADRQEIERKRRIQISLRKRNGQA